MNFEEILNLKKKQVLLRHMCKVLVLVLQVNVFTILIVGILVAKHFYRYP